MTDPVVPPATPPADPAPPATPPPATPPAPNPAPPVTPPDPKADEPRFTQADIDRIVKERLERAERTAQEKADAERKKLEEEQAKQQGEWQKLAEQRAADLEKLQNELKTERYNALRSKVATAHNLPADMATRLVGDDEAALNEDAKRLAELIAPKTPPPGNGPSPKPAGSAGGPSEDEARLAHRRATLSSW